MPTRSGEAYSYLVIHSFNHLLICINCYRAAEPFLFFLTAWPGSARRAQEHISCRSFISVRTSVFAFTMNSN